MASFGVQLEFDTFLAPTLEKMNSHWALFISSIDPWPKTYVGVSSCSLQYWVTSINFKLCLLLSNYLRYYITSLPCLTLGISQIVNLMWHYILILFDILFCHIRYVSLWFVCVMICLWFVSSSCGVIIIAGSKHIYGTVSRRKKIQENRNLHELDMILPLLPNV